MIRLILFLAIFMFIYGGMHVYAYSKLKLLMAGNKRIYLAVFLFIMIFCLFIVRISEKYGWYRFSQIMAYIGYFWMGFIVFFFMCSLAVDLYSLVAHKLTKAKKKISEKIIVILSCTVSICIFIYAYYEANDLEIKTIKITTNKISENVKIIQISDVHLGLVSRKEIIKNIIGKIKEINPDILISTGDLIEGHVQNYDKLVDIFRGINPKYGKYAIIGNHEYYGGISYTLNFVKDAGFTILRNEGVNIDGNISIIGIDNSIKKLRNTSENRMLGSFPEKNYKILLKHQPVINKESIGLFDIQLSGHTHGGQIFPFNFLIRLFYPVTSGYIEMVNGSSLYVSRGAGVWGPQIRFLEPSEITVIDLLAGT